jgi:hypothetical protein
VVSLPPLHAASVIARAGRASVRERMAFMRGRYQGQIRRATFPRGKPTTLLSL